MGKIYNVPSSIKVPSWNFKNSREDNEKADEKFIKELRDFVLSRKKGKDVGEIVQFQVADGYARYMVASLRPLELIHIPLDDAYEYAYVHRLTAKDIQESIKRNKIFNR